MTMARNWKDVRADAVAGGLDEERIANARTTMEQAVRVQRLVDVRKSRGETQSSLAAIMHVTQARVSKIESGNLQHSELGTLQAYVEALGGKLRVVADFEGQTITVG
jgi:predicted XRE-type DNA-binding protein